MSSSEDSVGIRAWANTLPGFTGILKQRCVDCTASCVCAQISRCIDIDACCTEGCWILVPWRYMSPLNVPANRRYSDFMVNEIDASGQVVHLNNKLAPQVKLQLLITWPC